MIKSDLSNVKVGDYILTLQRGWVKVLSTYHGDYYSVHTKLCSYDTNGFAHRTHKYPTAFAKDQVPPRLLELYDPPPCEFDEGDKVLVGDRRDKPNIRCYFSHADEKGFHCFVGGRDKWASEGDTVRWDNCVKWEEE